MEHSEHTLEELLSHARWVQRLAGHLVRGEDADDVVQDVWATALERPPQQAGSARGWLARVALNRVRQSARTEARRRRREQESPASPMTAATPEEAAAAMELQRLLAALVSELPEPYRHVVYLRYFQDHEPTEIARLLAVPAGTIRWRLKEALARLRAGLDERDPERRHAWVVAAWFARRAGTEPRAQIRPLVWGLAAVALATLTMVATFAAKRSWSETVTRGATTVGAQRTANPGPVRFAAVATPQTDDCAVVEPLRAQLATLKRAADPWRNPRELFAEAAPNDRLTAAAGAVLEPLLASLPDGCEHSLSCRGSVCELAELVPAGRPPFDCHPKLPPDFQDRLSSGLNNLVDSGTPFHDPLKGRSYTKLSQLWRFDRDDALPTTPQALRPPPPPIAFDFATPLPSTTEAMSDACRSQWARVRRELQSLREDLQAMTPEQAFATSSPDAAVTIQLTEWARKALDRPTGALPFVVECRARVCALHPGDPSDPLAIQWNCQETPPQAAVPEICFPSPNAGDWASLVRRKIGSRGVMRFPTRPGATAPARPAFLALRSAGAERANPWRAVLGFMESFDWRATMRRCEASFPERGQLETRLQVPSTNGDEDPPNRVSLNIGGALGGTKLAACIADAYAGASAAYTIPPISNGAVMYADVSFPFDAHLLEAKLASVRARLDEDRDAPMF